MSPHFPALERKEAKGSPELSGDPSVAETQKNLHAQHTKL